MRADPRSFTWEESSDAVIAMAPEGMGWGLGRIFTASLSRPVAPAKGCA